MPKYYIQDGMERVIQEGDCPANACAMAVLNKFATFMVNGVYNVSERGFDNKNQLPVSSDLVMEYIYDIIKDKLEEEDDQDLLF